MKGESDGNLHRPLFCDGIRGCSGEGGRSGSGESAVMAVEREVAAVVANRWAEVESGGGVGGV